MEIIRSGMSRAFWAGFFAHVFWSMFYQDLIGKDAYIQMIESQWVNLHWVIGLVLAVLTTRYYIKLKEKVCGYDPLP